MTVRIRTGGLPLPWPILQGAAGARRLSWLSALSSAPRLVSAAIGNLDTATTIPLLGLLGFFITVTTLRARACSAAQRLARRHNGRDSLCIRRPVCGLHPREDWP